MRATIRERHRDGHCAGGRIYGYKIEPDGNYKKRVQHSEQAPIVLEIFRAVRRSRNLRP